MYFYVIDKISFLMIIVILYSFEKKKLIFLIFCYLEIYNFNILHILIILIIFNNNRRKWILNPKTYSQRKIK
jgi:hypothetical protein